MNELKPFPFIFLIENKDHKTQIAAIGGFEKNKVAPNYGSDNGITISCPIPGISFLQIINQLEVQENLFIKDSFQFVTDSFFQKEYPNSLTRSKEGHIVQRYFFWSDFPVLEDINLMTDSIHISMLPNSKALLKIYPAKTIKKNDASR